MPPIRKFKREDIIDTAYNIVKDEGFESINARRIAKKLGCSIQHIFHNWIDHMIHLVMFLSIALRLNIFRLPYL